VGRAAPQSAFRIFYSALIIRADASGKGLNSGNGTSS